MADEKQVENVRRAIGFLRAKDRDFDEFAQRQFGDLFRDIERLQSEPGTDEDALRDFAKVIAATTGNLKDLVTGMVPVVQVLVALRTHETGASADETWDRVQALIEFRHDEQQ